MSSSDDQAASQDVQMSLESVRNSLIRQEDTIIFSLIERAKYKANRSLYDEWYLIDGLKCTFLENFIIETEILLAKFGRYENSEEHPFYQGLEPGGGSQENNSIRSIYTYQLLPLIVSEGEDKNRLCIAAQDLQCLQALSQRIHYGKVVAEVKFKDNPEVYTKAIKAKDKDGLMKLITFKKVEEEVIKRVMKKGMVFGQDVSVVDNESDEKKYKVDP